MTNKEDKYMLNVRVDLFTSELFKYLKDNAGARAAARDIRRALPAGVACVGVFVDETYETVMRIVGRTGITAIQLHGSEPPELVERLHHEGLFVIKALFADRAPGFDKAGEYSGAVFLAECGRGAPSRRKRAGLGVE